MPLRVAVDSASLPTPAAVDQVLRRAQLHLDRQNSIVAHRILLLNTADNSLSPNSPPALTILLDQTGERTLPSPSASLEHGSQSSSPTLRVTYVDWMAKAPEHSDPLLGEFLAKTLLDFFSEERAMVAQLEETRTKRPQGTLETFVKGRESEIERRQQRSMKYASTYHLTFSLFTPEASPSDWEIETALSQTIMPLLRALSPICNFTIDTQVQPYAQFSSSVQPVYKEDRRAWELKPSDLGGFINSAEWPLSPSIGSGPTINFLLYVPSVSQSPMVIEGTEGSSWLILQWGGIVLHKAKNPKQLLTADELREPFLTFSQNLLDLLGLPSPDAPFQLRLQSQSRILALRLITSASSTLGSLARLTQALISISIPDTVATSVSHTIRRLESSCALLSSGDVQGALDNAKIADEEAEKAFFHKSMVGQVYFPDEHKVAVYLPLLGPVAVPLIMTAVKELKAWMNERRSGSV